MTPKSKLTSLYNAWFYFSIATFAASLCFETVYVDTGGQPDIVHFGFEMLLLGALGFFVGVFAWLANPLLFIAWVFLHKGNRMAATVVSGLALFFALTFLANTQLAADINGASGKQEIIGYGPGYWLWIVSISATFVATVQGKRNHYVACAAMLLLLMSCGLYTLAIKKQDQLLIEKAAAVGASDELVVKAIGEVHSIELVNGPHEFYQIPTLLSFKAVGAESSIDVGVEVGGSRFHPSFRHFPVGSIRPNN